MSRIEVPMPQMGESIAEGTVSKWLKRPGDPVERDEPILEISTDKVDAEIPSPAGGVLAEVRVAEGETVEVGTVVAFIDPEGVASAGNGSPVPASGQAGTADRVSTAGSGAVAAPSPAVASPAAAAALEPAAAAAAPESECTTTSEERLRTRSTPVVRRIAAEAGVEISQVPGTGHLGRVTKQDILSFIEAGAGATADEPSAPEPRAAEAPGGTAPYTGSIEPAPRAAEAPETEYRPVAPSASESVAASPSAQPSAPAPDAPPTEPSPARPSAPSSPRPTQPSSQRPTQPSAPRPSAPPVRSPAGDDLWDRFLGEVRHPVFPVREGDQVEPMTKVRRLTAEHMVLAKRIAPHVHSVIEIDFTAVDRIRREKKAVWAERGARVSYTAFVAWACSRILRDFPMVNGALSGNNVVHRGSVSIGLAVDLDPGLIVPVVHDADHLSLVGIARKIVDLAGRARSRQLSPGEIQGATFTITNPGVLGTVVGMPVIPKGTSAILGTGSIDKRVVALTDPGTGEDLVAVRKRSYFSLGYDHRIVDGADSARFLSRLKATLEEFPEDA